MKHGTTAGDSLEHANSVQQARARLALKRISDNMATYNGTEEDVEENDRAHERHHAAYTSPRRQFTQLPDTRAPKPGNAVDGTDYLTASAKRIVTEKMSNSGFSRSKSTAATWQNEAWDMYDLVGELHFIINVIAAHAAKAELKIGYRNDDGVIEELDNGHEAYEILHSLSDGRADLSNLIHRWVMNLEVPGEGWLVGVPAVDVETGRRPNLEGLALEEIEWHLLSISEVARKEDEVVLHLDSDNKLEVEDKDVYLIRTHRPHPRRQWEADSPVRSAIPILKELVGLTMHVSAQVDSRLAGAGVLVVPQSTQESLRAQAIQAGTMNPNEEADLLAENLVRSMLEPIGDRASASAVVPMVMTIPDEAMGKVQHLSFAGSLDGQAQSLREEAIRRLALSMDIPPEVLLGTGDMNHWSSWLIREETVSTHITPLLEIICNALTQQLLWVLMETNGGVTDAEEIERYSIYAEVDRLVSRPNLSADAQLLNERGLLSDEATRRATGFEEKDAEKQTMMVVLRMLRENPILAVNPGTKVLYDQVEALLNDNPIDVPDDVKEALKAAAAQPVDSNNDDDEQQQGDTADGGDGAPVNDGGNPVNLPDSLDEEVGRLEQPNANDK